jgi:anti-sigma factor RsiW
MNCDWVQENIPLYLYNELADDARHELEGHVDRCAECASELETMRIFHGEMSELPQLEVTPNLLASSRMRLAEALETAQQHRGWRWVLDPMALIRQMRFSPALAAVIFMVGFGGGIGTMYRMSSAMHGSSTSQQEASIAGIRNIIQEPGSNQVRIDYERGDSAGFDQRSADSGAAGDGIAQHRKFRVAYGFRGSVAAETR